MDGSKLHEYQCKLCCLAVEAEYVIEMLLGFYSVQSNIATSNGITDPNEAFTAIVQHCHNNKTLKNVEKVSYLSYKRLFFDVKKPNQVKTEINIKELDFTISYNFLRNLDVFPTCKNRYKKQLKCKNLTMAGNHNLVCCNICMTCNNCMLLTSACNSTDIITAVVFIKDVRNFTAHLNFSSCEKIEKGDFSCIKMTDCSSWNGVLVKYMDAIKTVLKYLRTVLGISIDSRCINLDMIVIKNTAVYWNVYNASSIFKVMRENFAIINSRENIIKRTFNVDLGFSKVETAGSFGYLSRVASLFTSHQQNPFNTRDIDDPSLVQMCNGYRETVEKSVFKELKVADKSGKFEIVNVGVRSIRPSELELLSIGISIHIEFHKGAPECFINPYSTESQSLQKQIKVAVAEVVRNVLKEDVKVECTGWRFG